MACNWGGDYGDAADSTEAHGAVGDARAHGLREHRSEVRGAMILARLTLGRVADPWDGRKVHLFITLD
jgi:hypothetical protein